MENKDWLNDLKVGDKVFVVKSSNFGIEKQLKKVIRITPTRRIVVDNLTFINGVLSGNNGFKTSSIYLEQVTENSLKEYNQNKFKKLILHYISLMSFEDITYEQAKQINDILNLGGRI